MFSPSVASAGLPPLELDVRQDSVERSRDALEVECLHQEHGVLLLAVPHEAVQLILERPGAMCGLLLVGPERAQLALLREDALHSIGPHRPRQLVFEVARAGVEPDSLELAAVGAPQGAQEMRLLAEVVEPRESDVAVLPEEAWQVPVAAHRHDCDALGPEVAATATRKRLDGAAVARALNEHHSAQLHNWHEIRSTTSGAAVLRERAGMPLDESLRSPLYDHRKREAEIRFMLLTYNAPGGKEIWAAMSEAERAAEEAEYRDLIRSMREERIFLAAEEVEHYDAARTVLMRDGILSVSDGPAVNADAFLTGYFLIEVESFETAINWAARIPNARTGSVEVRPVMDIDW